MMNIRRGYSGKDADAIFTDPCSSSLEKEIFWFSAYRHGYFSMTCSSLPARRLSLATELRSRYTGWGRIREWPR